MARPLVRELRREDVIVLSPFILCAQNTTIFMAAPDKSETVLLIIDLINDLDFAEANQLMRYAPVMARRIAKLKERAKKVRIPSCM